MRIVSANITGSLILNNVDVTDYLVSSSNISSSVNSKLNSLQSSTSSLNSFTSSYSTGSFTGSFKGDGTNLYNIPATGVTGLQLDKIASGAVTASVSANGFNVNSNVSITGSIVASGTSLVSGSSQINITGTTEYSTFSSSISTSIDSLSSSVASTTNTLSSSVSSSIGSLSSSVATTTSGLSSSLSSSIGSLSSSVATTTVGTKNRVDSIEAKTGSYATTGSNTFIGTENITGNLTVTGSVIISSGSAVYNSSLNLTDTSSLTLNSGSNLYVYDSGIISGTFKGSVTGSLGINGNVSITGSIVASGTSLVSGSSQIDITSTTNYTTFSSSVSISIGNISSSVATTTLNLSSSVSSSIGSLSSSVATTTSDLSSSIGSLSSSVATNTSGLAGRITTIEGNYATTGSNIFVGNQVITGSICSAGNIVTTGQIVAQTINVQQVTSSIVYSCGSNIFGTDINNTQQFTGSMFITGSNFRATVGTACFSGNVCALAFVGGTVSGTSGTFSGDLTIDTNILYVDSTNDRVGIGLTTPSSKLHIQDSTATTTTINSFAIYGATKQLLFGFISDGTNITNGRIRTGGNIPLSLGTSSSNDALFITNAGNVGIGTNTPLSKFDVALSSGESLTIGNCSNTITCGDLIGALTFVSRDGSTNSTGGIAGIRSYATQTYNTGGVEGDLRFYTSIVNSAPNGTILSGSEVLKLSQDGVACFCGKICTPHLIGLNNISIGSSCTTSDGYNTRLRITNIANDTFVFSFNNQACRAIMYMYGGNINNPQGYTAWADNTSGNTNHLISHNTGQATYFATQGGCVGIGTSSPSAALQIRRDAIGVADVLTLQNEYTTPGVTAGQGIGIKFIGSGGARDWGAIRMTSCDTSSDNYFMSFHVRDVVNTIQQRMIITSGGNVGIGTSTPCSILTLRGTDLASFTSTSFGNLFLQTGAYDASKMQSVDFGSATYPNPLARIAVKICSNGSHMMLGTSNDYSPGITNCAIYINWCGNVGLNTDPSNEKFVVYGGSGHGNVFLRLKTDGCHGIKPAIHFDSGLVGTNRASKVIIMGGYSSPDSGAGGALVIYTNDTSENSQQRMCIDPRGAVTIMGALAKGSGSFRICHPLPSKVNTHALVHSFIEGPNADLIYSGHIKLTNGVACINIDCSARMTQGTFEALNRCVRIFTTNETSWDAVRGKVCGNMVIIESQNNTSEDKISWMVIGERHDQHMFDTEWTDNEGRVITEPELVIVNDDDIV